MKQPADLSPAFATTVLPLAPCHLAVPLERAMQPRLLWMHAQAGRLDPTAPAEVRASTERHAQHLLRACAWVQGAAVATANTASTQAPVGLADRYGGNGVGHHGGSGRSVYLNGYSIKGIGRTPLVSAGAPEAHASGGAYLEEAVREAIFSVVAGTELPLGTVPVLAIIETGQVQVWQTAAGPKPERRVLIVRPWVLRAAHFERALGFDRGEPFEGMRDAERVRTMFDAGTRAVGSETLCSALETFGQHLARQVAHGFIHRLWHGSPNTSNIGLNGALLDFGAMSALPSWADVATMLKRQPFEGQFQAVAASIRSLSHAMARHLPQTAGNTRTHRRLMSARAAYCKELVLQFLRLLGAPQGMAEVIAASAEIERVWNCATALIRHYQQEHLDFADDAPKPQIAWDIERIWDMGAAPPHLRRAKELVLSLIPTQEQGQAMLRCKQLARTRTGLFREPMKHRLHAALEGAAPGGSPAGPAEVAKLINTELAAWCQAL